MTLTASRPRVTFDDPVLTRQFDAAPAPDDELEPFEPTIARSLIAHDTLS